MPENKMNVSGNYLLEKNMKYSSYGLVSSPVAR